MGASVLDAIYSFAILYLLAGVFFAGVASKLSGRKWRDATELMFAIALWPILLWEIMR